MFDYDVYTDGGCKGVYGSWAYLILQSQSVYRECSGREKKTDSNRMEFQAVIEALKILPQPSVVKVVTDCRLLIENAAQFEEWHKNDWIKKNGRSVPNFDLFQILFALMQKHQVSWQWVKAHSGNIYNERCDELCVLAREIEAS